METLELVKVCSDCNRKYTHTSEGYNHTGKCICKGSLVKRLIPVSCSRYVGS